MIRRWIESWRGPTAEQIEAKAQEMFTKSSAEFIRAFPQSGSVNWKDLHAATRTAWRRRARRELVR